MQNYIKIMALFTFLFGIAQEGRAQSPCFELLSPRVAVTGAYADPATSLSPNAKRVFWLTWGTPYAERAQFPYGKPGTRLEVGSKSYGSIDLGGGRFMCLEATITLLNVSGTGGAITYIPGTYSGDFLDDLYNIGGPGGPNGNPNNKMASGIINGINNRTINIVIEVKATINGEPERLRGLVLADAESLDTSNESIIATVDGQWYVAEVEKNIGQGPYNIKKVNNPSGTQSVVFAKGNNKNTGAVAFLEFDNTAYASKANDYAVSFSSEFKGRGYTAIAIGLLTSGYDLGDAPESYGKPIHLIDDINFIPDGIIPDGPTVNVNTGGYSTELIDTTIKRYLGTTAPDADLFDMYSDDALGDDISGTAGFDEEDAWPHIQIADNRYRPGDKITATIPYKKGETGDKISGWIDFDLNGTFDAGERVTKTIPNAGDGNVILEWTVPQTRVPYSTYVRLRYFGKDDDATRPTGTSLHGEVEDHRIYIMTQGTTNPMLPSKSKQGQ